MSPAQLCLAWVLSRGDHVLAIPGTTSPAHLEDNLGLKDPHLVFDLVLRIDALINRDTVAGARYPAPVQATIDTEEF